MRINKVRRGALIGRWKAVCEAVCNVNDRENEVISYYMYYLLWWCEIVENLKVNLPLMN